jgi:hypothetical protein
VTGGGDVGDDGSFLEIPQTIGWAANGHMNDIFALKPSTDV